MKKPIKRTHKVAWRREFYPIRDFTTCQSRWFWRLENN